MAENSTVARPYAQAAFEVARDTDLAGYDAALAKLAALAADPQMHSVFGDPLVGDDKIVGLLLGLLDAPAPEPLRALVALLVANGRITLLPEIADRFTELRNANDGVADAEIVSAFPLEAAQLDELVSALGRRFGSTLHASVRVDPELIGGVRVTVGDEVLDTSVRTRLDAMRLALTA